MKNLFKLTCSLSVATIIGMSSAYADGKFDNAIKARKALMSLYAWNLGQLGAMAKGEAEYDAETAKTAAENLRELTKLNLGSAWPQGSDSTTLSGATRAKAEAWSTYPESANIHKALVEASTTMANVAGNGLDQVRANIGAVGEACSSCHKKFRETD